MHGNLEPCKNDPAAAHLHVYCSVVIFLTCSGVSFLTHYREE